MKLAEAFKPRPMDPMLDPDLDGIAFAYAAGTLYRDEAIDEWTKRGVEKYTAFRWLTQAEGLAA